ncbi:MAG: hypothetical protein SPJ62_11250 [Inconstantimicrobium porci]|uniref:hypothetical protein n=1 Tax=Inconstantimicrobium porci TaxID=2652291 RepID=UPI002A91E84B|nr:hypothetical protein [Inconstantimicrobium porci]MDY5912554.1 hypothetical protein [Inconstantimicrobium porci]
MIKKILLTVLAVIVVFIGSVVWIVKANDKENKDNAVSFDKGNSSKTAMIVYQNGRSSFSKDTDESVKFKDVFKTEVIGSFKVVKSKFDADKDLPIKEVRKIIK